ncbi:MAG: IS1380 family transposase, partial [Actinomycetota bacterium]|nr:IS1380 family transposase [Actinomycetota bacterium]
MIPESEGTCSVKASHNLARVSVTFDEDHLAPSGGLAVAGLLAQRLGVAELVDEHVTLSGDGAGNGGAKALTVVGSALAGGDCIEDVDVLRAGATPLLFDEVRAPSTVGTWLRLFVWAAVRQLDRVTRELLRRARAAGLGPDPDADLTIDIDSTVVETYGLAKQGGARFSYKGVRGYHPLVASLSDTGELLHTRLRGGNAASGRGAASFVAETIARVPDAGARGGLTLRADSGFYAGAVVSACRRGGVAFSVTARKNASIRKAIDAIPDAAWTPIAYWIDGGADVAETDYTAFAGTRHEVTCRLLVRRVRPTPGSQLAMDVVFDYHAILTNRDGDLLEVEADHRRHAVVEHVVDDLKHHAGLAHLPSGRFAANAAWLALVGVAYNLARWTANAAGL